MLVAGHQPNYLPYLGFFHKLACVDRFMIVDLAQFVKRGSTGWMHRNRIRTQDGWQWLSLPIVSKGRREQRCVDAELQNEQRWAHKHWKAIAFNYRRAPHFAAYKDGFEAIYQREWLKFSELSVALIREIARVLRIETPIVLASEHGVDGEAHELLENICKHYGTKRYFSGPSGKDYLDLDEMKRRGVELEFQQFKHPVYQQCQPGDFVPGMCALDLIFNTGPDARQILLG